MLAKVTLLSFLLTFLPLRAQEKTSAADWAVLIGNHYRIEANRVYHVAGQFEAKLDVYVPRDGRKSNPTVLYFHSGGWFGGSKEVVALELVPYLEMDMTVVNVEDRLAGTSLAPAAVADCRCALRWVVQNAEKYGFDISRLVVAGRSAGGHLALMAGMLDASSGFDNECPVISALYTTGVWKEGGEPAEKELRVAAVVNFYGVTDVAELLDGPLRKPYAVRWLGNLPNREEMARRVSPLTYVRGGIPPVLTIHHERDPLVPYDQAVRLHDALKRYNVPNQLLTIPGAKHWEFSDDEILKIHAAIRAFFKKHGVLPASAAFH